MCWKLLTSVAYLGGVRCDAPPLARPWKFFTGEFIWKGAFFAIFIARIAKFNNVWWSFAFPNFRKMGKFAVFIEHSEAKSVSASGGKAPLTPRPGALPLDPRYRLALCALAMTPLCQRHCGRPNGWCFWRPFELPRPLPRGNETPLSTPRPFGACSAWTFSRLWRSTYPSLPPSQPPRLFLSGAKAP